MVLKARHARSIRYGITIASMAHGLYPSAARSEVFDLYVPSEKQKLERAGFTRAWERFA